MLISTGTAYANVGPKPEMGTLCFYSIPIALLSIILLNHRVNWLNPLLFVFLTNDSIRTPYMLFFPVALYIGWFVLAWIYSAKNQRTGFNWMFFGVLLISLLISSFRTIYLFIFTLLCYGIWFFIQFGYLERINKSKSPTGKSDEADNPEPKKKSVLPVIRKTAAVILGIYFISVCFITISSQRHRQLYYDHKAVMEEMTTIAKKLESIKEMNTEKLYPDEKEFNKKLREDYPRFCFLSIYGDQKLPGLEVVYKPSPDRKKYILCYNGDVFRKSRWFLLPKGYPQYDSVEGVIPGKREPFF